MENSENMSCPIVSNQNFIEKNRERNKGSVSRLLLISIKLNLRKIMQIKWDKIVPPGICFQLNSFFFFF